METIPSVTKPIAPPKPLARLSNQDEAGNKQEGKIASRSVEGHALGSNVLSNDHASSPSTRTMKCLGPKPALLPKPLSPLKKCIKSRPAFLQRPDMLGSSIDSTGNTKCRDNIVQEPKKKPLSLFMSKAPVAKLDEFDSLYEKADAQISPTRPPRSPKMKVFPEGPFKKFDEKPELPVKKRLLHGLPSETKDEVVKKRSSSLGRSGNDGSLSTNVKSKSLGRNVFLSEELALSDGIICGSSNTKMQPVPPPRRRKKSEESQISPELNIVNVPIYAHVNYEMKKNRREMICKSQQVKENCEKKKETFEVLEGRLLLTGNTLESNNRIQLMETCPSDNTSLNSEDRSSIMTSVETLQTISGKEEENNSICREGVSIEEVSIDKRDFENDKLPVDQDADDFIKHQSENIDNAFIDGLCEVEGNLLSTDSNQNLAMAINTSVSYLGLCTSDSVIPNSGEGIEGICPNESQLHSVILRNAEKDLQSLQESASIHSSCTITRNTEAFQPREFHLHGVQIEENNNLEIQPVQLHCDASVRRNAENFENLAPIESLVKSVEKAIEPRDSHLHRSISGNVEKRYQIETLCDDVPIEPYIERGNFSDVESMKASESEKIVQNEIDIYDTKESFINHDAEHQIIDTKVVKIIPYQNVNVTSNVGLLIDKTSRPMSTPEVSEKSDLVIVEEIMETKSENEIYLETKMVSKNIVESTPPATKNGAKLWRRQSWSSSKDTTPSPSSVRKQKHASGPWCDEGELSNGALADSDSSDNAKHPVRNKIATWFDSFGKGGSKRKERRSRFYAEGKQSGCIKSTVTLLNPPEPDISMPTSEDQIDGIERPSSGVSRVLDSPSFDGEIFRDSESDNEEQITKPSSRMSEVQQKERKVFLIARELMTSERQFVDVLRLLNINFLEAVNSAGMEHNPVLPALELSKIINSLPQLQSLNEVLLRDLESRIKNWSSHPKIADVIVKKGPFLKLYSSYIQNFETQCNYLDEFCQKYPRFGKVVKEFEASPVCKKLEVKHYMLKPVQRIPQYRLLLEDYQRHLEIDSVDYKDTEEALKIVRDVADHANRTIKLGDHLSKLIDLQSQLDNYEIIKPGRVYLKDGELFKLSRKVRHPRYFILLNDCLLYTSRLSTSLLRVNKELPLNGMKVSIPPVDDNLNEFNIISITRSFTLSASSEGERREWIDALESAIKDHTSRALTFQATSQAPTTRDSMQSEPLKLGRQAPVWIQDTRVTMCQSCTTPFTVMFRRHHCRACGKVVCSKCSDNRAPLRYMDFQADRVCEGCHDTLFNEFEGPDSHYIVNEIMSTGGFTNIKDAYETTRALFKKLGSGNKKKHLLLKKDIPQRLKEVAANDSGSQMSGWLQRRGRRSWKRLWFVLKEQVLYVYKASEDIVALESIPILGYKVETMTGRHFEIYEGIEAKLVFQLAHVGQLPLVFHADTEHLANRWMKTMEEATILH